MPRLRASVAALFCLLAGAALAQDEARDPVISNSDGPFPATQRPGEISGRLSFMRPEIPPMRVCALPAGGGRAYCVDTDAMQLEYLIDGLPALEYYYVLAYPQEDNAERVTMAYAEPVAGCGPNRLDCASGVLKKVFLNAGQRITNVDPASYYTRLPPRFAEPPR